VQGGLTPVSGGAVTLYAAGTAYGAGAVNLGGATTNGTGNFTVTYTAPTTPTVLYISVVGGNAGGGSNTALGLIGVAGMSNALPASVTINELTTAAAETALAQFTDSTGQIIGSPSTNAIGFDNAVHQLQVNLADIVSGGPASFWSAQGVTESACTGGTPPVNCDGLERLNTIANILAACVQSSGPSSSPCTTLLSNTGAGATTSAAAHFMATNPASNVAALFPLQGESPPFTPELTAAPDGWEVALNFNSGSYSEPIFVAMDAAGDVWAPNGSGDSVTELVVSGPAFSFQIFNASNTTGANFDGPDGIGIDSEDNVWVTNFSGDTITELPVGCVPGSCTAHNFDPTGANFVGPFNIAIDTLNSVWVTNRGTADVPGESVTKLNSSGGLIGNFDPDGADFDFPQGIAIDTGNNAWIANTSQDAVVELNSSGGLVGSFSPDAAEFDSPAHVSFDANSNLWVSNIGGDTIAELLAGCSTTSCTALNFDPDGANFDAPAVVELDSAGNAYVANEEGDSMTVLNSSGGLIGNFAPAGADFDLPDGLVLDASGNVWVANVDSDSVAEIVGLARPVMTPLVACLKQTPPHPVCLP
jgi:streptogramin lyase